MRKTVAIIQARMGSTRFPKKVLMPILEKEMLWHIINRLKKSNFLDEVVIATTKSEEDKQILRFTDSVGIKSFAGSEEDVLDRYYQATKKFRANTIVRITADCPLIDPMIIDKALELFYEEDFDYVSNYIIDEHGIRKPTYPDGLDVEVFSFFALEKAWREGRKPSEREHVTPYIWSHPKIFKIGSIQNERDLSHFRWTVDYPEDLEFVREIYKRLYKEDGIFYMEDVIRLIKEEPKLIEINKDFIRNEGYNKSLRKDFTGGC